MKIITDSKRKECYFRDVEQGQVFIYDDRYAMAIQPIQDLDGMDGVNTIFLDDGSSIWIEDYETVATGFDAALVIG